MGINDFLAISKLTNNCPKCGSDTLGNGEGALLVNENLFTRSCKCGFHLEYDTNNGVSRNKIMKAIYKALRDDKIRFCVESVFELEGVTVDREEFEKLNDDELNDKVAFYDYLWTK